MNKYLSFLVIFCVSVCIFPSTNYCQELPQQEYNKIVNSVNGFMQGIKMKTYDSTYEMFSQSEKSSVDKPAWLRYAKSRWDTTDDMFWFAFPSSSQAGIMSPAWVWVRIGDEWYRNLFFFSMCQEAGTWKIKGFRMTCNPTANFHFIWKGLMKYADGHSGKFPNDIAELYPQYVGAQVFYAEGDSNPRPKGIDNSIPDMPNSAQISYKYTSGLTLSSPPESVVLEDNTPKNNESIGATNVIYRLKINGTVEIVSTISGKKIKETSSEKMEKNAQTLLNRYYLVPIKWLSKEGKVIPDFSTPKKTTETASHAMEVGDFATLWKCFPDEQKKWKSFQEFTDKMKQQRRNFAESANFNTVDVPFGTIKK